MERESGRQSKERQRTTDHDPHAGIPVDDDQDGRAVLHELPHDEVDGEAVPQTRDDARAAEDPHQLDQPQQPHDAHRLEVRQVVALQDRPQEVERQHGDQVDREPARAVTVHDLAPVRHEEPRRLVSVPVVHAGGRACWCCVGAHAYA